MGYGNRVPFDGAFPSGDIVIPENRIGSSIMKSITVDEAPGVRNYPAGAILHFDADADYENEAVGMGHGFNSNVLAPQYQRNADGSYTDVGAKPAVDVYDGEKWLRSCGAVTNLFTNSIFEGAVSGTPGTAPEGWSLAFNSGQLLVDNQRLIFSANVGRNVLSQNISLLANTTYVFSVLAEMDGEQDNGSVLLVSGAPVGATLSYMIDNSTSTQPEKPIAGLHVISVVVIVGATAGTAIFRVGIGCASNRIGTVTISNPQLTATAYPLPYVPTTTAGPVTQPASNATTTNGAWFALPDGSPLWQALDGQPDGVELADINSVVSIDNGSTGCTGAYNSSSKTLSNTTVGNNPSYPRFRFGMGAKTIGQRYHCRVEFSDAAPITGVRLAIIGATQNLTKIGNVWSGTVTADNIEGVFEIHMDGQVVRSVQIVSAIIQRIQPQPLTLATRVMMGVGSGDLTNQVAVTDNSIVSCLASNVSLLFFNRTTYETVNVCRTSDKTTYPYSGVNTWKRGTVIRMFAQVNSGGTSYRAGYYIEGASINITWGRWVAYDGSFGPSTLYRLMLGYNNAYPMWFNKIAVWRKQCTDAEIMEALS